MDAATFAEQLEIFHGRLTPANAYVYAQIPGFSAAKGYSLTGFLRGPHCLYGTTLPATVKFVDAGPGETLLAKATLPDPCFWSPAVPALYEVHVELRRGGELIASCERQFGMRAFEVRGRFFYDLGRRYVLRGVASEIDSQLEANASGPVDLLPWHDAHAAMLVENPSSLLCEEASRAGVLLVAGVSEQAERGAEIRRLARFAAVAIITLQASIPIDNSLRLAAKNTILARRIGADVILPDGDPCEAEVVTIGGDVLASARKLALHTRPVIAWRKLESNNSASIETARAACDDLQAAIAPCGDFAGYFV